MKICVGITDKDWYEQLSRMEADEVNFWSPGSKALANLQENDMFLFKLHYPDNFIVGGAFFVRFTLLPPFLAWDAFQLKNGVMSYDAFLERISKYRDKNRISENMQIGCTILTEPFWFRETEWISPKNWLRNTVRGKIYDTDTIEGRELYDAVIERIQRKTGVVQEEPGISNAYSESVTRHRLGQGGFRIMVTDAYQRRCAITGEKTLPVLEAAHIMPYSENGPHLVRNGLLLKSDYHTLFDRGYITITKDYRIEISKRLHDDYGNGHDYYAHNGQPLLILPQKACQRPDPAFLEWHNEHVFLG